MLYSCVALILRMNVVVFQGVSCMETGKLAKKDLFDELGLEVSVGDVEVGQTYPIFGMITDVSREATGNIVAELNHNIKAKMKLPDDTKLDILKERAFETGIFISKVTQKHPTLEVECLTVIFGRKQSFNA